MSLATSFRNLHPQLQQHIQQRPPYIPSQLPDTPPPAFNDQQISNTKGKRKSKQTVRPVFATPIEPVVDKYDMETFFSQSKQIKELIIKLKECHISLNTTYRSFLSSSSEKEQQKLENKIEDLLQLINRLNAEAKFKIDDMSSKTDSLQNKAEKGSADMRMRTWHHASLLRQFQQILQELQKVQKEFSTRQREQIKATFLIVRPFATLSEMNRLFDSTGGVVLTKSDILALGEKGNLAKTLDEMKGRRQSVLNIETGIKALNQMFIDMQTMVYEQQDQLDRLEDAVENVEDYLEEAKATMTENVQFQKAIRKKKCSII